MFSRRHYNAVATILRDTCPDASDESSGSYWGGKLSEWQTIVWRFANLFANDNPRFDRDRFFRAIDFDTPFSYHAEKAAMMTERSGDPDA